MIRDGFGAAGYPVPGAHLRARQIRLALSKPEVRLVTHLDITDNGVRRTLAALSEFFA